ESLANNVCRRTMSLAERASVMLLPADEGDLVPEGAMGCAMALAFVFATACVAVPADGAGSTQRRLRANGYMGAAIRLRCTPSCTRGQSSATPRVQSCPAAASRHSKSALKS